MSQVVTVSIVLYNHRVQDVCPLFEVLARDTALSEWVVVNNGGSDDASAVAKSLGAVCLNPGVNLGYGAAHNLALRSLAPDSARYHLILNPDIQLPNHALDELGAVMDAMPQVGLLMPRILYPDGSMQYLCKLLPTPLDLILRRFAVGPFRWFFDDRMNRYDMKDRDYSRPMCAPVLSGCFMFARRSILDSVGGFDERFFLYMEDTDLCRRMGDVSRLLFWPGTTVIHRHAQGSYKNFVLLGMHVRAAIAYFNKWGWWRDPVRDTRNHAVLTETGTDETLIQSASRNHRADVPTVL